MLPYLNESERKSKQQKVEPHDGEREIPENIRNPGLKTMFAANPYPWISQLCEPMFSLLLCLWFRIVSVNLLPLIGENGKQPL